MYKPVVVFIFELFSVIIVEAEVVCIELVEKFEIEQLNPLKLIGHLQINPRLPIFWQTPLFRHGFGKHAFSLFFST
jgi:hypothetical protein